MEGEPMAGFPHRDAHQRESVTVTDLAGDDLISGSAPLTWRDIADCCPAAPSVRIVFPPTPSRPHRSELTMCAHHFAVHRRALGNGAIVTDAAGHLIEIS